LSKYTWNTHIIYSLNFQSFIKVSSLIIKCAIWNVQLKCCCKMYVMCDVFSYITHVKQYKNSRNCKYLHLMVLVVSDPAADRLCASQVDTWGASTRSSDDAFTCTCTSLEWKSRWECDQQMIYSFVFRVVLHVTTTVGLTCCVTCAAPTAGWIVNDRPTEDSIIELFHFNLTYWMFRLHSWYVSRRTHDFAHDHWHLVLLLNNWSWFIMFVAR